MRPSCARSAEAERQAEEDARAGRPRTCFPRPSPTTTVPNFVIQRFRIPIFLLPIYQAAGIEYGVRWEVLAAINEIETDYGRNLNVSYAGAQGWMQFMPATWKAYGTDANRDGERDPYNPVDAIFAAARYLKAAGAETDLRSAIFAYNHADWYVADVLERAEEIAAMPTAMVGALTGLADGRFPVRGPAEYEGALDRDSAVEKVQSGESPARVVNDDEERDYMDIEGEPRARVVSVSDGKVLRVITSKRGRRIGLVIEDSYGNRYSYYGIRRMSRGFYIAGAQGGREEVRPPAAQGANVPGGTLLGRLGRDKPMLRFGIRPAGEDAPLIDPKPMLDGWRLLEKTAVYRPSGRSVLHPEDEEGAALDRPGDPAAEVAARAPRPRRQPDPDLPLRPHRHRDRPHRPPHPGPARVSRRERDDPDRHLTPVRPRLLHDVGQRLASLDRHRGRHRRDQRHPDPGPPGGRRRHRPRRARDHAPAGRDGAGGDHLAARLRRSTFAMGDHHDHIHVGYQPGEDAGHGGPSVGAAAAILEASQWDDVVGRVGAIKNPRIREQIQWHDPANASCKYKRAMDAQGTRRRRRR